MPKLKRLTLEECLMNDYGEDAKCSGHKRIFRLTKKPGRSKGK